MVTHVVLLKLSDSGSKTPAEVGDLLRTMEGRVPQLRFLEVGVDELGTERSYDVALLTRFSSWADAKEYQDHPYHREVLAELQPSLVSAVVADYETP